MGQGGFEPPSPTRSSPQSGFAIPDCEAIGFFRKPFFFKERLPEAGILDQARLLPRNFFLFEKEKISLKENWFGWK